MILQKHMTQLLEEHKQSKPLDQNTINSLKVMKLTAPKLIGYTKKIPITTWTYLTSNN